MLYLGVEQDTHGSKLLLGDLLGMHFLGATYNVSFIGCCGSLTEMTDKPRKHWHNWRHSLERKTPQSNPAEGHSISRVPVNSWQDGDDSVR